MSHPETVATAAAEIDMSQFYRLFFDETAGRLAMMETLLLAMDPAAADGEELNAIFRAAHAIKGGSGTFGFTDMMEVTQELESLLDKARRGEIVLTGDMVDALLAAGAVLGLQLAWHRGDPGVKQPPAAEICARIRGYVARVAALEAPVQDEPGYGFFTDPAPAAGSEGGAGHGPPGNAEGNP